MFKKITIVMLAILLMCSSMMPAFAEEKEDIIKKVEGYGFDYTYEKYLEILPFKMSEADNLKAKELFNEIGYAFFMKDLNKAAELIDQFYDVVAKYWMSEKTLESLLPLEAMIKDSGQLITPEDIKALNDSYKSLSELREKKSFEAYFAKIKTIYNEFYLALADAIGDMNNELQLVQYIKGADKLSLRDLATYDFDDYLKILPFDLSDSDYDKGDKIFGSIIDALKGKKNDIVENKIKELNNVLAPYWIKEKTFEALIPHKDYEEKIIKYFTRKGQVRMHHAYENAKKARLAAEDLDAKNSNELFDEYFKAINEYYSELGEQIRNYYGDFFDEVVFIRS